MDSQIHLPEKMMSTANGTTKQESTESRDKKRLFLQREKFWQEEKKSGQKCNVGILFLRRVSYIIRTAKSQNGVRLAVIKT